MAEGKELQEKITPSLNYWRQFASHLNAGELTCKKVLKENTYCGGSRTFTSTKISVVIQSVKKDAPSSLAALAEKLKEHHDYTIICGDKVRCY